MKLFCHLCKRLCFRDTCGKCRKVIDARYEAQLRIMRGLRELNAANYVVVETSPRPRLLN